MNKDNKGMTFMGNVKMLDQDGSGLAEPQAMVVHHVTSEEATVTFRGDPEEQTGREGECD